MLRHASVKYKNRDAAGFLGYLFCFPAYIYVGGWRYGIAAATLIVIPGKLIALIIPQNLSLGSNITIVAVICAAGMWKGFSACIVRNELIFKEGLSIEKFASWRYVLLAMCDLVLGICMLAPSAFMLYLTMSNPFNPSEDLKPLIAYWLNASLDVWVAELVCGFILVRASEAYAGEPNPFLAEQNARWGKFTTTTSANDGIKYRALTFFPTLRELRRAIILPIALCLVALLFVMGL
jgi:hypothetical protein